MEKRTFTQNQQDRQHYRENIHMGVERTREVPILKEEYLQISHRQITGEHIPIAKDILQKGYDDAIAAIKEPARTNQHRYKSNRSIANHKWTAVELEDLESAIKLKDGISQLKEKNTNDSTLDEYVQKKWQPHIEGSQKSLKEDPLADKHALIVNTIGQAIDKIKDSKLQIINGFTGGTLETLAFMITNNKRIKGNTVRDACQKLRLFREDLINSTAKTNLEKNYGIMNTPEKGIAALDEYRNGLNGITILNSITDSNTQGIKGVLYRAREDINKKYKDAGLS